MITKKKQEKKHNDDTHVTLTQKQNVIFYCETQGNMVRAQRGRLPQLGIRPIANAHCQHKNTTNTT